MPENLVEARIEQTRRLVYRWWWVATMALMLCNVPVWLEYMGREEEFRANEVEFIEPEVIEVDTQDMEAFIGALAASSPIDEDALLRLADQTGLQIDDVVPM